MNRYQPNNQNRWDGQTDLLEHARQCRERRRKLIRKGYAHVREQRKRQEKT